MNETDRLDRILRDWGAAAEAGAQQPVATPDDGQPRRVRRLTMLVAFASTACVIAAVVVAVAILSPHGSPPSASTATTRSGSCTRNFTGQHATLSDNGLWLTVSMTYRGRKPCSIRQQAPGVLLIGDMGFTKSNKVQQTSATGPRVVVKKGWSIAFSISAFHLCLSTPSGNYRIVVSLGSPTPPAGVDDGVAVPIGHLEPSPALCLPSGIGQVSPLTISPATK
jgi:hypothetical protein